MVMVVSSVHPLNTDSPNVEMELGIVISTIEVQSLNAKSPMVLSWGKC